MIIFSPDNEHSLMIPCRFILELGKVEEQKQKEQLSKGGTAPIQDTPVPSASASAHPQPEDIGSVKQRKTGL